MYNDAPETATLDKVSKVAETSKALLLDLDGFEQWVPRSVIQSFDPNSGRVKIELWWLNKNGILA